MVMISVSLPTLLPSLNSFRHALSVTGFAGSSCGRFRTEARVGFHFSEVRTVSYQIIIRRSALSSTLLPTMCSFSKRIP